MTHSSQFWIEATYTLIRTRTVQFQLHKVLDRSGNLIEEAYLSWLSLAVESSAGAFSIYGVTLAKIAMAVSGEKGWPRRTATEIY